MANFCILRVKKLHADANVGASIKHNYRDRDTPNADQERTEKNRYCGQDSAQAMARYRELLPAKIRKNGVRCLEYLVTASPESFEKLTSKQQIAYFNLALKFIRDRHGAQNVFDWGLHHDEKTPHLCVFVVPKVGEKLNARYYCGGRDKLSELQTDFFETVGRPLGLERGIKGSRARHQTIKQFYARAMDLDAAIEPPKKKLFETAKDYKKRYRAQVAPVVAEALDAARLRQRADQAAEQMKTIKDGFKERNRFFEGLTKEQQQQFYLMRDEMRKRNTEQKQNLTRQRRKIQKDNTGHEY